MEGSLTRSGGLEVLTTARNEEHAPEDWPLFVEGREVCWRENIEQQHAKEYVTRVAMIAADISLSFRRSSADAIRSLCTTAYLWSK